ncbi:methyl-accepting chemotaxis protein, partial [Vibrio sp. 10N.222.51.A6]
LFAIALLPVIILSTSILAMVKYKTDTSTAIQEDLTRTQMMNIKRNELANYVEQAETAIYAMLARKMGKEEIIQIIKYMKFGQNGYLFGYSSQGIRNFSGSSDEGVGENFNSAKDTNGNLFIKQLIVNAKRKEFTEYFFPKPGTNIPLPKLSYSTYISELDLVIGTGVYYDVIEENIQVLSEISAENAKDIFFTLTLETIISLMLLTFIIVYTSKSILNPLTDLTSRIAEFANGEGDLTQRVESSKLKELNALSKNFNVFIKKLNDIIRSVSNSSNSVNSHSQSIQQKTNKVDGLINHTNDDISQLATAMEQMSTASSEISHNAATAAQNADEALKHASTTLATADSGIQSIRSLVTEIEAADKVVKDMDNHVGSITHALGVISEIAEQTNLLALNAAIEAARAGEQGRGFAVVADEVRNLASRTQLSTREIADVIEQLNSTSSQAVNAMKISASIGVQTIEKSNAMLNSITEISQSIEEINAINTVSATATEEQTCVLSEIKDRIDAISKSTQETAHLSNSNNDSSNKLENEAKMLKKMVGKFKVH